MKILFATEANEGLGHLAPWLGFFESAAQEGWQLHVACPDAPAAQARFANADVSWQRACIPAGRPTQHITHTNTVAHCWEELLVNLGYGLAPAVRACLAQWQSLLHRLKPDLLIADYAPLAMLAAKALRIPLVQAGGGYCVPPITLGTEPIWLPQTLLYPGPSALPASSIQAAKQAQQALSLTWNAALQSLGSSHHIVHASEIFAYPVQRWVMSGLALDHYAGLQSERGAVHMGLLALKPLGQTLAQVASQWLGAQADQKRVLCYLKPSTPNLNHIVQALRASEHSVLFLGLDAQSPKLSSSFKNKASKLVFASQGVDLPSAFAHCDVFITNGGLHSLGHALARQIPCVLIPEQMEQALLAARLMGRNGVYPVFQPHEFTAQLRQALATGTTPARSARGASAGRSSTEDALIARLKLIIGSEQLASVA